MKNFYYSCELNLSHPEVEAAFKDGLGDLASSDSRIVTMVSRPFQDEISAYASLELDITKKMKRIVELNKSIELTKINEMNPYHLNSASEIEQQQKADKRFAEYLETWDHDVLCRVTCTTEECDMDEEGDLIALPEEYAMKYEVKSFEDDLAAPAGSTVVAVDALSSTVQ